MLAVNTPINVGFTFRTSLYWTCSFLEAAGSIDPACVSGATLQYTFTAAGVYNVTMTVTDDDGGSGSAVIMIVVYDPSAGFVTGGGWINSPAGAYAADPTLTGKATFGFVAKYQKGANLPSGNTEFQFKVGNLNFKSTSYEWLVVAGTPGDIQRRWHH